MRIRGNCFFLARALCEWSESIARYVKCFARSSSELTPFGAPEEVDGSTLCRSGGGNRTLRSGKMSSTTRKGGIKWPGGPGHDLGQLSLTALRSFYNDPSGIGWKPCPSIDASRFMATFRLEHTERTAFDVNPTTLQITADRTYKATGSFEVPATLEFLGTSRRRRRHETCSISLGPDCLEYICSSLLDHSKALFSRCRSENQDRPFLITHSFAKGYEDMIEGLLIEMLTMPVTAHQADTVSGSPDTARRTSRKGKEKASEGMTRVWQVSHEGTGTVTSRAKPSLWVSPGDQFKAQVSYLVDFPPAAPASDRAGGGV